MTSQPADGEPRRLGARGEPRALDHHDRAAFVHGMPSSRPRATMTPAHHVAVRVGEGDVRRDRPVVERVRAVARAVDELIADHEVAGLHVRLQRAARVGPEHPLDAQLLHRPHVGPVRDLVRRELVLQAVAGDERHAAAADLADHGRRAGRPVRRVDVHGLGRAPGTSRSRSRRTRRSPRVVIVSRSSFDVGARTFDVASSFFGATDSVVSDDVSEDVSRRVSLRVRRPSRRLGSFELAASAPSDFRVSVRRTPSP